MAKLYWRVKKNNEWTWIAAEDSNTIIVAPTVEAIMMLPTKGVNFISSVVLKEEE